MRSIRLTGFAAVLLLLAFGLACNSRKAENPPLKDNVKKAMEQADLKDVTVDEDVDKNVITLGGKVHTEDAKNRAGDVAKSAAPNRVIANEISIEPVDNESAAKDIAKNVDDAIEKNYKAALIANHLDKQRISFKSKNGVLTLKGRVNTADDRQAAQDIAKTVPKVQQVINELQVKNRG
jgi:hyperosmotically inducible periplasmic protein